MSSSLQKDFYDTAFTGLNLSLLRIGNWKQEDTTSIAADAAIVKAGKQRLGNHLKIEMSSWSAPGRLKPSGSVNGSDGHSKSDKSLKTSSNDPYGKYVYSEFAHWWKTSLQSYEQMGIIPDYISLQNEPDMEATYEETLFEPTETSEIAGYKQALQAVRDSVSSLANPPKILGPEPLGIGYNNFEKYAKALDNNNLDGYAYHLYHAGDGNDNSGTNYLNPENFRKAMTAIGKNYGSDAKPIIMTEFCTMENAVREQDMLGLAHIMQVGFTSGKLNAYIAWELFWGEQNGQLIGVCPGNGWSSCTEAKLYINPEYHAMRHSKFVNPGWRVVSTTSDGKDLYAVAFRSADCDSISVIAINKGSAQNLSFSVNGYTPVSAVQSVESGDKSKAITAGSIIDAPAKSITTVVFTTSNTAALQCEDSPIEDPYIDPSKQIGDSLVIVNYADEASAAGWTSDKTLDAVTFETTALDGVSKYVKVPLANCAQDDCGYQHALFTIPDAAAVKDPLIKCKELVFTMRSIDTEDASVNIGGAGGSTWQNYQYGNTAPAGSWAEVSVPLDNEIDSTGAPFGSTQLSFNSDNAGIYIAKIVAKGCGTSSIKNIRTNFADRTNSEAMIFDLNGNLVWKGLKNNALNDNGTIKPKLHQGAYILKTKYNAQRVMKN